MDREKQNQLNIETSKNNDYRSYGETESDHIADSSQDANQAIEKQLFIDEYKTDREIIINTVKEDIINKNYEDARNFVDQYRDAAEFDDEFKVLVEAVDEKFDAIHETKTLKTLYDITDHDDIDKRKDICKKVLKIDPKNKFFRRELYIINTGHEPEIKNKEKDLSSRIDNIFSKATDVDNDPDKTVDKDGKRISSAMKHFAVTGSRISFIITEMILAFISLIFLSESFLYILPLFASIGLMAVHWRTLAKINYKDAKFIDIFSKISLNFLLIIGNFMFMIFI